MRCHPGRDQHSNGPIVIGVGVVQVGRDTGLVIRDSVGVRDDGVEVLVLELTVLGKSFVSGEARR